MAKLWRLNLVAKFSRPPPAHTAKMVGLCLMRIKKMPKKIKTGFALGSLLWQTVPAASLRLVQPS